MDLLTEIMRHPIDPDYAVVATRGGSAKRMRWGVAVVAVLAGVLFAVSGVQTTRAQPVIAEERRQLITRIDQQTQRRVTLGADIAALRSDITRLQAAALGAQASGYADQVTALAADTGAGAVKGPGVVLVADDGDDPTAPSARIVDVDVRQAVNALWASGAEAIAVNGHRLSSRTAIREAGDAVTVDYVSLTAPYRIEAIGDPLTLEARFAQSPGGTWWQFIEKNYGISYAVSTVAEIQLPADPGLTVTVAKERHP